MHPSSTTAIFVKLATPITMLLLFMIAASTSYWLFQGSEFNRPLVILDVSVVSPRPIYPGDMVTFRTKRFKQRHCSLRIDKAIISASVPHKVEWSDTDFGGFSPLGTAFIDLDVYLPIDLDPGEYSFAQIIIATCGNNTFVTPTASVDFIVSQPPPLKP